MINNILRYLGYEDQVIDDKTQESLNKAMDYVKNLKGKYVYKILENEEEIFKILKTSSRQLEKILKGASKFVIYAGTLGIEFDKTLRRWQVQSPSDGMILNACASVRIESIIETMVNDIEEKEKLHAGQPYSPGYGDLSLSVQENLLSYLQADKKVGIVHNQSYIMIPSKSITGVFGLFKEKSLKSYEICDGCILRMTCDQKLCRRKI